MVRIVSLVYEMRALRLSEPVYNAAFRKREEPAHAAYNSSSFLSASPTATANSGPIS